MFYENFILEINFQDKLFGRNEFYFKYKWDKYKIFLRLMY